MLNNQTLQTLRSLKLTGMADALEQQLAQPATHEELGFEERLALLVDREMMYRTNNKVGRLLKAAKLKLQASPEDIDHRHRRGLIKSQFADLLTSQWVHQHHNVLIRFSSLCYRRSGTRSRPIGASWHYSGTPKNTDGNGSTGRVPGRS